jgi:hypothetical protein
MLFGVIYKTQISILESSFYNKIYIGKRICKSTNEFYESKYVGSSIVITRLVKKYSKENIRTEIIYMMFDNDIQTKKEKHQQLSEWEKHFIKLYDSQNPEIGINLTSGGDGFHGKQSSKWIIKRVISRKKYYELHPDEINKGSKNGNYGKGYLHIGQRNGMFGKGYLVSGEKNGRYSVDCSGENNQMFGKHHTKESIQKNSE